MLGLPSLQSGLLRQRDRLGRRRRPAMSVLEIDRQLRLTGLDRRPPTRPRLPQPGRHTDDLPHRPLARIPRSVDRETQPQPGHQMRLQLRVVHLRDAHHPRMQRTAIDRQPRPIQGLDLVRDSDMGVEIRIPRPRIPMRERRRDQPCDLDLPHPTMPTPREQDPLLQIPQRVRDRRVVSLLDLRRHLLRRHRPQRRHRLHRRERHVIARARNRRVPRQRRHLRRQLQPARRPPHPLLETSSGELVADTSPHIHRHRPTTAQPVSCSPLTAPDRDLLLEHRGRRPHLERRPQAGRLADLRGRRVGRESSQPGLHIRMEPGPEQGTHLYLRHRTPRLHLQGRQAGTDPPTRHLTLLRVVARQRRVTLLRRILRSNLPGQVVIPRPGSQLVQRRRHTPYQPEPDPATA